MSAVPIDEEQAETARWYRSFAESEAAEQSPLYAALCDAIAGDAAVLALLGELPAPKRQPNLVLASYRWIHGTPSGWDEFRSRLLSGWPAVRACALERRTQTNEPGRCALFLPILARLPQPIALIEVGASAGLCLLPERYGYDYGSLSLRPASSDGAPVFLCQVNVETPLPERLPEIGWRAGLDLNPLDVADRDAMAWLETLVWPGQEDRLERLSAAIAITRAESIRIVRGDLTKDFAALMAEIPMGMTKVVIHTAVLNYVPSQEDRDAFAEAAMRLADCWIANEAPGVFPQFASAGERPEKGLFALTVNGRQVAWTHPHGRAIWWLEGEQASPLNC